MKKIAFVLILSFIACINLLSYQLIDVVYLKDGTTVRGTIIEQQPNVSVKIETPDGNVQVYSVDEIVKILKEEPAKSEIKPTSKLINRDQQNKYHIFYLGALTGGTKSVGSQPLLGGVQSSSSQTNYALGFVIGNEVHRNNKLGLGIEYDRFTHSTKIPIFIDYRMIFKGLHAQTFIFADLGYSMSWIQGLAGMKGDGLLFNPGFGIEGEPMILQVGYRYQWSRVYLDDSSIQARYNYVNLNVGIKL